MKERSTDICCISEIWEKESKKKHKNKIEEIFELHGIKYISTPRINRTGGGAAIAVNVENFNLSKLNVFIPVNVTTVWGLVKPKKPSRGFSTFIICSFYSPPDLGKNTALINHLTITLQTLLNTHKNAGVFLCGDRNKIEDSSLLTVVPSLKQLVNKPTHDKNILDVICTNIGHLYQDSKILPPLAPDNSSSGVPSDHSGVELFPDPAASRILCKKVVKMIRPLPESLIHSYRSKLTEIDFLTLLNGLLPDNQINIFEEMTCKLFDETFPEKKVVFMENDKPWFTEELRLLKRQRMREYSSNGKSKKYIELRDIFKVKAEEAMKKHTEKLKAQVVEGRMGSIYPPLKKLSARPGSTDNTFHLPNHTLHRLTPQQSSEIIAEHFSKISQEFLPLDISLLPSRVRDFLSAPSDQQLCPQLSVAEVKSRICKARKPKGIVTSDLPKKIVQNCSDIIAVPAQLIFNNITRTSTYPSKWKIEHQVAIPKTYPPEDEDDLRNIAKTPFLSKVYESFVANWLLKYIKPFLDPNQCGLKGSSISHYLIKLLHFIHSTLDSRKPHAVLLACIDLKKAFNRVDHSLVIEDLYDMHTPSWLLKIVASYLSERSMKLCYNGAVCSIKDLPGGSPQGAYLGRLIFIIKCNGVFLRPSIPRNHPLHGNKSINVEYIDDGAVAAEVDLKAQLVSDPVARPLPLTFHERTGHVLPPQNNLLQVYLNEIEGRTIQNKMIINMKKTHTMLFTRSRKFAFPPEMQFLDGTMVDVVQQTTLLGVIITDDLKWKENTTFICLKARRKLWTLKRMKLLHLNEFELFDVYKKEIRSILEYAAPVWHSSITKKQISEIESIQKISF